MTIITVCLKLVITLVRVIDLCWGMGKSSDWGVTLESNLVFRTRILLPEAKILIILVCTALFNAGHSYQAASNESPDDGYSIILPAFFKPLPISPRVAVSSGDQWLNCIPLLVASVLFSFYDHKRERNTRFIQVDVYKALYFSC